MSHAPGYGVPGEAGQPFLVAFVEQFVTGLILLFHFHIPHGGYNRQQNAAGRPGITSAAGERITVRNYGRDCAIRACSQASTSLFSQRELRPSLMGAGKAPSLMSL